MIRNDSPRQAIMPLPGEDEQVTSDLANRAVEICRQYMPRVTGASAASLDPISGPGWFGVEWTHESIYFQETGTKPFTMRSLSGKTIPMWVYDGDGKLRSGNPKIKTRIRQDSGETQVLIFRKAAEQGARTQRFREVNGRIVSQDVPASYPGAPGRIAVNRNQGIIRGKDGRILPGNVGVRWRHPGLDAGYHLVRGLAEAAGQFGLPVGNVEYAPASTFSTGDAYDIVIARS